MPLDGASSTIFWWRRWIEHSRSPSASTAPWVSARTCTSTCRGRSTYGSTKTLPSPNAASASRRAAATAASSSRRSATIRIPRPPPPYDALTSSGRGASTGTSSHHQDGSTGTPAVAASRLASALDPIAAMASGGGPTQTRPASSTARANAASSDRKP